MVGDDRGFGEDPASESISKVDFRGPPECFDEMFTFERCCLVSSAELELSYFRKRWPALAWNIRGPYGAAKGAENMRSESIWDGSTVKSLDVLEQQFVGQV